MQVSLSEQRFENPWAAEERPKARPISLIIAAFLFALASASVTLVFYSRVYAVVALAVLLGGCFYLLRQARRPLYFLLLLGAGGFFLWQSFLVTTDGYRLVIALSTLPCVVCVGILAGGFLQTACRRQWILPLLLLPALAVTFFVTRGWAVTLAVLLLLLPAWLLALATKRGAARAMAVCAAAVGLLIGAVGLFLLWLWRTEGALSLDLIRAFMTELQNSAWELSVAWRAMYFDALRASVAETPNLTAEQLAYAEQFTAWLQLVYSTDFLLDLVTKLLNMLPAFLFIACAAVAYLSQAMLNAAYASNGMRGVLTPQSELFTMSIPATVIYLFACSIMLLFSTSFGIAVTAADNLCLMLMSGFLVLAVRGYLIGLGKSHGFGRVIRLLLPLLVIFFVSQLPSPVFVLYILFRTVLPLLALYGAYKRLFGALRERMEKNGGSNGRAL